MLNSNLNDNHYNNITFIIRPTEYNDYDILIIGSYDLLKQLSRKIKHSNFIKKSKFGGIPILIVDTCDTLKNTKDCIKQYKKMYKISDAN